MPQGRCIGGICLGKESTRDHVWSKQTGVIGWLSDSVRAVARLLFPAVAILAILYGSLIPFRFDFSRLAAPGFAQSLLAFRDTTPEDVAVNLLAYAALGGVLIHACRCRNASQAILVLMFCSLVSVATESAQALIPQRVSSATDVMLNALGAALGTLGCRLLLSLQPGMVRAIGRELRLRPLGPCAIVLSSGLIAYSLIPFDFITNTPQLHAAFHRIQLLEWPSGLAAITDEIGVACWFALLGFLMARDALTRGRSRIDALRTASQHGLILACLIECLQLFTNSHIPEMVPAAVRFVGALLGAWTAIFVLDHSSARARANHRQTLSTQLLLAAAAIQFLFLAINLLRIQGSTISTPNGWSLPFQKLWLLPAPLAGANALSTIITAAILTATLAAALRQVGLPIYRALTSIIVLGSYIGMECFNAGSSHKPFDPTNALLAVLACGFALRLERRLAAFDALTHPQSAP